MNYNFKPYYAVIFTSARSEDHKGYNKMSELMESLAKKQKGFLGVDSARNDPEASGGITVSYWESLESIKNWKMQTEHLQAQFKGKQDWYSWYKVRICKVEREYEFLKK